MPFGKHKGDSVEQILLKDYKYFTWVHPKVSSRYLKERFDFVDYVSNNFISKEPCSLDNNPAKHISVYHGHDNYRGSSIGFLYCSNDCFNTDPKVLNLKAILEPLQFRTALSSTKFDTNQLVGTMSEYMGLKKGRKTKEYLEEFFNNIETYKHKEENKLIGRFF